MGNLTAKRDANKTELDNFDINSTYLDIKCGSIKKLPVEKIGAFKSLKWLNIPYNQLEQLPKCIIELENLVVLRLVGNYLNDLPEGFCSLVKLKVLDLSKNKFKAFPSTLRSLPQLEELYFGANDIVKLPSTLGDFPLLNKLGFDVNKLTEVNVDWSSLPQLESLDFSNNNLGDFQYNVTTLSNLTNLRLCGNNFIKFPEQILKIPTLKTIDLRYNQLRILPDFSNLKDLKILQLRNNEISHFFCSPFLFLEELVLAQNNLISFSAPLDFIGNFLSVLHLYSNNLQFLPEEIYKMQNLRELDVSENCLTSLPDSIYSLSNLQTLDLSNNHLQYIDEKLSNCISLENLNISNNELTSFPGSLGKLINLKKLELHTTRISSFPQSCSDLSNLMVLTIGNNPYLQKFSLAINKISSLLKLSLFKIGISDFPLSIYNLTNLVSLDLSYNYLRTLPFADLPKSLNEFNANGNLLESIRLGSYVNKNLKILLLSNNLIREFPSNISNLPCLEVLNLSCNQISTITDRISSISDIRFLDLSHNRIISIPESIGNLHKLVDIDISNNLIEELPSSFKELSNLLQLKISFNPITKFNVSYNTWVSYTEYPKFSDMKSSKSSKVSDKINKKEIRLLIKREVDKDDELEKINRSRSTSLINDKPKENTDEFYIPKGKLLNRHFNSGILEYSKFRFTSIIKSSSKGLNKKRLIENSLNYIGWSEMCGRRPEMQDTLAIIPSVMGIQDALLVGLFDGHGGSESSEYVAHNLNSVFVSRMNHKIKEIKKNSNKSTEDIILNLTGNHWKMIIRSIYRTLHSNIISRFQDGTAASILFIFKSGTLGAENTEDTMKSQEIINLNRISGNEPYLEDEVFGWTSISNSLKFSDSDNQSTQNLQIPNDGSRRSFLVISNCGDQRVVLCRKGKVHFATVDHKPEALSEIKRIKNAGGFVAENRRVNGLLALSRSLGDGAMQPHITFEPDIFVIDLVVDDEFIIIACDGLWDVLSSEEAIEIVNKCDSPSKAAATLRDYAYSLGSFDNISVIVIYLFNYLK